MNVPKEFVERFAAFPLKLRNLVLAEIAAGNSIVEIGSGFPAPPAGACLKLTKLVSTRPRKKAKGLDFYERNKPDYSGEFTDGKRFYFVLEPALPTPAPPDMDAIRAAMEAGQRAADAELYRKQAKEANQGTKTVGKSPLEAALALLPQGPMPEMEAIREAYQAWERAANAEYRDMNERDYGPTTASRDTAPAAAAIVPVPMPEDERDRTCTDDDRKGGRRG